MGQEDESLRDHHSQGSEVVSEHPDMLRIQVQIDNIKGQLANFDAVLRCVENGDIFGEAAKNLTESTLRLIALTGAYDAKLMARKGRVEP